MSRWWKMFLAWSGLSHAARCAMSRGRGLSAFHTWRDTEVGIPWVFGIFTCRRCGKPFRI
jgi:hypothetical protein